jgi:hypothetical protein
MTFVSGLSQGMGARKKWGQTEVTRVSRTLQTGVILPEEVSNGKASDLQ